MEPVFTHNDDYSNTLKKNSSSRNIDLSSRHIRVFISSTFKDMQEERDYLVKFIFPQLRKICESRGVIFSEVDLRWGITDEQVAEGKVLPICLNEIQRSKPYFIGLLGERYGWIPTSIDTELVEQEPWLIDCVGYSVTELEILHGVLNNPDMANHALFYFRDPKFVERIDESLRQNYIESPLPMDIKHYGLSKAQFNVKIRKEKLDALKNKIRASGFPVRENYIDPKQLGDWVLKDLSSLINNLYPESSLLNPIEKERLNHELVAQSYTDVYVCRENYFSNLDLHVEESHQPLVILGDAGSGKSALLANWAINFREKHPDVFVLLHFIGATPESSDFARTLHRIMSELQLHFNVDGKIPTDLDKLRLSFISWLHKASEKGKSLIIIDGLNKLEDKFGALELTWLPNNLPKNVCLIFSTLPGKTLEAIKKQHLPSINVEPLQTDEVMCLIQGFLSQYSKQLNEERTARIAYDPQSSNPLALRVLLDELRQYGVHEQLDEIINRYLSANSISEIYEIALERYEQDYDKDRPGLVMDTMSYIWAARRGISENELLSLLGQRDKPMPHRLWSPFHIALEQTLLNQNGLLKYRNDYIRQAVENKYLSSSIAKVNIHINLSNHFEQSTYSSRKMEELPWQLEKAHEWQRLYDLLKDPNFFSLIWQSEPSQAKIYWKSVESHSSHRIVVAYKPIFENPFRFLTIRPQICDCLAELGYISEGVEWLSKISEIYRKNGDVQSLLVTLHDQITMLEMIGDQTGIDQKFDEFEKLFLSVTTSDHFEFTKKLMDLKFFFSLVGFLHLFSVNLIKKGEIDKAWNLLAQALAMYQDLSKYCEKPPSVVYFDIKLDQALILHKRGKLNAAFGIAESVEKDLRGKGDYEHNFKALNRIGMILVSMGKYEEALKVFNQEEITSRNLGDLYSLASSLGHQGSIHYQNNLVKALELFEEQENISRKIKSNSLITNALVNKASVFKYLGKIDLAKTVLDEAVKICEETNDLNSLQNALGELGLVENLLHNEDVALSLLKRAEVISRQISDQEALIKSLSNQAIIYEQRGCLLNASLLQQEIGKIYEELNYE